MKQLYLVHTFREFLSQAVREMKMRDIEVEFALKTKLLAEFKGRLPTARQLTNAVRDVISAEK